MASNETRRFSGAAVRSLIKASDALNLREGVAPKRVRLLRRHRAAARRTDHHHRARLDSMVRDPDGRGASYRLLWVRKKK